MKYIIFLIGLIIFFWSCKNDDSTNTIIVGNTKPKKPIEVSFSSGSVRILEGNSSKVYLSFSGKSHEDGHIDIELTSKNAVYLTDYTTDPVAKKGLIRLPIKKGNKGAFIKITGLKDIDKSVEKLTLTIKSVSDEKLLKIVSPHTTIVEIYEVTTSNKCNFKGISSKYSSCLSVLREDELNVVTWNIQFFNSKKTVEVKEVINNMHPDIIAIQEVYDNRAFTSLGKQLKGWEARLVNVSGDLDLGFLFKTCEVSILKSPQAVLRGSVEPRPAIQTTVKHISGMEVTLLNIHLKCCGKERGNGPERRKKSSLALKKYLDNNLKNKKVIVLGDWNDHINSKSPFTNFINDASYKFADQAIADGSSNQWSYPSYPSHIDHILISNELYSNLTDTKTLLLDRCMSNYLSKVSDHRPVMASFR